MGDAQTIALNGANCGKVAIDQIRELDPNSKPNPRTKAVEDCVFDPIEPVDTVYTQIDDLAEVAEIADAPLTERQKIDIVTMLFLDSSILD